MNPRGLGAYSALVGLVALGAAVASGEVFGRAGLYQFEVPQGWQRAGAPPPGAQDDPRVKGVDLSGLDALYYDPASGKVLDNLSVYTVPGSLRLDDATRLRNEFVEEAARTERGLSERVKARVPVNVESTGRGKADGVDHAFLVLAWSTLGVEMRQYSAYVPGRGHTYVFTFTCAAGSYAGQAELRERVLSSIVLVDGGPPTLWGNPLVWTCGGGVGVFVVGAVIWAVRRRSGRSGGAAAGA